MSEDQGKTDVRGTVRDWPAAVMLVGVVLWVALIVMGQAPKLPVYAVILFGGVAWLIRRGAFSPRR